MHEHYDLARYMEVGNVDQAIDIILSPTAGMTAKQRWENEASVLMRIIERYIASESMVLDYGCGIGRLVKPLITELRCKVVGVDISFNMQALAISQVASPMFYTLSPEMFFTIRPFIFDAAIAVWSLQHCIDLQESINHIVNSLKSDGKLVLVNNKGLRSPPIEDGKWTDDGQDIEKMIVDAGFFEIENGQLDESVAPGWMQEGTFWAVYQKAQ